MAGALKVPEARLELAQGFNSPTDFKSGASADSATRAFEGYDQPLTKNTWNGLRL